VRPRGPGNEDAGEYDACDVTLSAHPYRASLKNMPGHCGNPTYDLWNTSPVNSIYLPGTMTSSHLAVKK
jgi:hypothetical protein